jgi:hypothetical protein
MDTNVELFFSYNIIGYNIFSLREQFRFARFKRKTDISMSRRLYCDITRNISINSSLTFENVTRKDDIKLSIIFY